MFFFSLRGRCNAASSLIIIAYLYHLSVLILISLILGPLPWVGLVFFDPLDQRREHPPMTGRSRWLEMQAKDRVLSILNTPIASKSRENREVRRQRRNHHISWTSRSRTKSYLSLSQRKSLPWNNCDPKAVQKVGCGLSLIKSCTIAPSINSSIPGGRLFCRISAASAAHGSFGDFTINLTWTHMEDNYVLDKLTECKTDLKNPLATLVYRHRRMMGEMRCQGRINWYTISLCPRDYVHRLHIYKLCGWQARFVELDKRLINYYLMSVSIHQIRACHTPQTLSSNLFRFFWRTLQEIPRSNYPAHIHPFINTLLIMRFEYSGWVVLRTR